MRTLPILANRYWNDTGVQLTEGARYRMTVVAGAGSPLRDAKFTARSIAGEDWKSLAHKSAELVHGKRIDDARWFALIGTVEREHPWVVTDGGVVTAPASGALICFFNDVQLELFYRNNDWSVVFDVEEVTAP
jgi:hypothetical protein